MPNKRTGQDYLDITRSMGRQTAEKQRAPMPKPRKKKKTETVQELLLRDKPKKGTGKASKPKQPKMGSAEGWADLRERIKKDKEKQKKSRKTLPHKI